MADDPIILESVIGPGDGAKVFHLAGIISVFEISIGRAPAAIAAQFAASALFSEGLAAANLAGQRGNELFPGFSHRSPAQIVTQRRILDGAADGQSAEWVYMDLATGGNTTGKHTIIYPVWGSAIRFRHSGTGHGWRIQLDDDAGIEALGGYHGIALWITVGAQVQPGCAQTPVGAEGASHFDHLRPLVPVLAHGEGLDDHPCPGFLQQSDATQHMLESSGRARDAIIYIRRGSIERHPGFSRACEQPGNSRRDQGTIGFDDKKLRFTGKVFQDFEKIGSQHRLAAGDRPIPDAQGTSFMGNALIVSECQFIGRGWMAGGSPEPAMDAIVIAAVGQVDAHAQEHSGECIHDFTSDDFLLRVHCIATAMLPSFTTTDAVKGSPCRCLESPGIRLPP